MAAADAAAGAGSASSTGEIAITPEMRQVLRPADLAAGWRLACRGVLDGPLTIEVAQWEMPVLGDAAAVAVEPAEGLGIAIDLGTTTLVAQIIDLATGAVLGVRTALNPQAAHGADVMSRLAFAVDGGAGRLTG